MNTHLKIAKNEAANAGQQAAKSGIAVLTDAWPESFQQLFDSVANGEELPQSVLDRLEKNAQMLANFSTTNIPQPSYDQQQGHDNDSNN